MEDETSGLWLFGYGSLIWKPPPHFDRRVPGYINRYVRRFWQASEDHRGTPQAPGRVVTLIDHDHWKSLSDPHANAPERVWGAAYHIPPARTQEVKEYLDIREINGYSIQYTPFYPAESVRQSDGSLPEKFSCLVYIGLPENPQFVGPQDLDALAAHILKSVGPSGENKEYLYMLEMALETLSPESVDEHVSDLAGRCRELERARGPEERDEERKHVGEGLTRVRSTEEQEEVE
ncbi:ChaC-like protein [Eremomyces bilateralis CBS 781.70]|uniref:glutathione-specific gamma-glutamylcyclotransferase n=1 Tax=Eremomyces bilateralis CBS 781.70 TaxID=1392243 RepID=A0A6G1G2T2_9PEZI|nr:ChaC-like protein [Eremomyces bilateralis CBS 781.70]KAF1812230.1 ChaC-like protein [Eremomyces bilateralis CBS 781.70]